MTQPMQLIESINEAVQNAEEFNWIKINSKSIAFERFSLFYHWYYFSNLDIFHQASLLVIGIKLLKTTREKELEQTLRGCYLVGLQK